MNDLNDPLDDLFGGPAMPAPQAAAVLDRVDAAEKAMGLQPGGYLERCPERGCRGGKFYSHFGRYLGPCHKCKGKGTLVFKTSPAQRQADRAYEAQRKLTAKDAAWAAFKADQPNQAAWIEANPNFDFAIAMREAVLKYGALTVNQSAAILKFIDREAQRKADAAARAADAKPFDLGPLMAAFGAAGKALKKPKLRMPGFEISFAGAHSRNPGALYVVGEGDTYLGKIMNGVFARSAACTSALETAFRDLAANPQEAAIKYARLTGRCGCCGAELTNPESIARGIGPICAERFGW